MRNFLLAFGLILSALACSVNAQDVNKLFIVPADENGSVVSDGAGGYVGQVEMIADAADDNIYSASGVDVKNGKFAVYGISGTTGLYSFYGPNSWAVKPLPVNYSTPLSIAVDGTMLELPVAGRYDFMFYDRDVEGISYHMLKPVPADASIDAKYPAKLFLVDRSNRYVELDGDMATGVYDGEVTLPAEFRISYEPRFATAAFIFGPADNQSSTVNLEDGVQQPIEYATGTSAVFSPDAAVRDRGVNHVEVNLAEGYIALNPPVITGIDDISADDVPGVYYTVSGVRVNGTPDSPGIYIVKKGNACHKVVFSR